MKFKKEDIGKTIVHNNRPDSAMYHFTKAVLCTESMDSIFETVGVVVEDGIHDCDGACLDGTGIWVIAEDFDLEEEVKEKF